MAPVGSPVGPGVRLAGKERYPYDISRCTLETIGVFHHETRRHYRSGAGYRPPHC